jgi:N-acetylmuramoyl-L-alanine amidase
VLRETKMPAILTENLFIDNTNDAAKLKSEQFLQQIAYGHVQGIVKAFGLKKKAKPQPKASDGKMYRVQVGAFTDPDNAKRLAEELQKKGYPTIIKSE